MGRRDSPAVANHVLEQASESIASLSEHPDRGNHPHELLHIGIQEFRQILFKPYRIVYRVRHPIVYVLLVSDGRRDMQALLQRRLLEG